MARATLKFEPLPGTPRSEQQQVDALPSEQQQQPEGGTTKWKVVQNYVSGELRRYQLKQRAVATMQLAIANKKIVKELNRPPQERTEMDVLDICALCAQLSPFFRSLPLDTTKALAAEMLHEHYPHGEVICEQGTPGDKFYCIISGSIDVLVSGNVVSTLKEGATFGEMALISGQPRSASCVCSGNGVDVLIVDKETFIPLFRDKFTDIHKSKVDFFINNVRAFQGADRSIANFAFLHYVSETKLYPGQVVSLDATSIHLNFIQAGECSLHTHKPTQAAQPNEFFDALGRKARLSSHEAPRPRAPSGPDADASPEGPTLRSLSLKSLRSNSLRSNSQSKKGSQVKPKPEDQQPVVLSEGSKRGMLLPGMFFGEGTSFAGTFDTTSRVGWSVKATTLTTLLQIPRSLFFDYTSPQIVKAMRLESRFRWQYYVGLWQNDLENRKASKDRPGALEPLAGIRTATVKRESSLPRERLSDERARGREEGGEAAGGSPTAAQLFSSPALQRLVGSNLAPPARDVPAGASGRGAPRPSVLDIPLRPILTKPALPSPSSKPGVLPAISPAMSEPDRLPSQTQKASQLSASPSARSFSEKVRRRTLLLSDNLSNQLIDPAAVSSKLASLRHPKLAGIGRPHDLPGSRPVRASWNGAFMSEAAPAGGMENGSFEPDRASRPRGQRNTDEM